MSINTNELLSLLYDLEDAAKDGNDPGFEVGPTIQDWAERLKSALGERAENGLKPCPFCGGRAEVICLNSHRDHSLYFVATCVSDGCMYECATPGQATEEAAQEAWNRRFEERKAQRVVAVLHRPQNGDPCTARVLDPFALEPGQNAKLYLLSSEAAVGAAHPHSDKGAAS